MLKGIIFDMDGVLINSEPLHYEIWRELLLEQGIQLEYEIYQPCIGSTAKILMEILQDNYGIDRNDAQLINEMRKRKAELIAVKGFPVIPSVPHMLKRLHKAGYLLAIASSSPEYYIKDMVEKTGLESYFQVLCSGESVKNPKPSPDVFLKAARELGVGPEECMVVEDSTNGSRAAKAAGMTCVGFENRDSGNQDLSMASIIVQGFDEVDDGFMEKVYCRDHKLPVTIGAT